MTVGKIWLTHGHIDHAGAAAELRQELGVPIEGPHRAEEFLLGHIAASGLKFGMFSARNVVPDRWLDDGDEVEIGALKFKVLHCPGHSPGSVAFFNAAERFAIVGDVLFCGSIGRSNCRAATLRCCSSRSTTSSSRSATTWPHLRPRAGQHHGRERASNPFLK